MYTYTYIHTLPIYICIAMCVPAHVYTHTELNTT